MNNDGRSALFGKSYRATGGAGCTHLLLLTRLDYLPDEQQRQAFQKLALLHRETAFLVSDCHLEAETLDLSRSIQAEFRLRWRNLEEVGPR